MDTQIDKYQFTNKYNNGNKNHDPLKFHLLLGKKIPTILFTVEELNVLENIYENYVNNRNNKTDSNKDLNLHRTTYDCLKNTYSNNFNLLPWILFNNLINYTDYYPLEFYRDILEKIYNPCNIGSILLAHPLNSNPKFIDVLTNLIINRFIQFPNIYKIPKNPNDCKNNDGYVLIENSCDKIKQLFYEYIALDSNTNKDFGILIKNFNLIKSKNWSLPSFSYINLIFLEQKHRDLKVNYQKIFEEYPLPKSEFVEKLIATKSFKELSDNLKIKTSEKRIFRSPIQTWKSLKEFSYNYLDDKFPFVNSLDDKYGFLYIAGGSVINNLAGIESANSDIDIFIHTQFDQPDGSFKKSLIKLLEYFRDKSLELNDTMIFIPRKSIIECVSLKYGVHFQIIIVNTHNHLENVNSFDYDYDQAVIRHPNSVEISHNCLFSIMTRRSYNYTIPEKQTIASKARIVKSCLKGFTPFTHKMTLQLFESYASDPQVIAHLNKGLKLHTFPLNYDTLFEKVDNNKLYNSFYKKYHLYSSRPMKLKINDNLTPTQNFYRKPLFDIEGWISECYDNNLLRGFNVDCFSRNYDYNNNKNIQNDNQNIKMYANDIDIKGLFNNLLENVGKSYSFSSYLFHKESESNKLYLNNIKFRVIINTDTTEYCLMKSCFDPKSNKTDYRILLSPINQYDFNKFEQFNTALVEHMKPRFNDKNIHSYSQTKNLKNQFTISEEDYLYLINNKNNTDEKNKQTKFECEISLDKIISMNHHNNVYIKYRLSLHNKLYPVENH